METAVETEQIGGGTLETWSVDEVQAVFDADRIVLIDVRTPQEYMLHHIAGSLLAPMAFFDPAKLPAQGEKRIVLFCGSGNRSGRAAKKALDAGIDRIAHMGGGFGAWKEAKKPYIGTDSATGAPEKVNYSQG